MELSPYVATIQRQLLIAAAGGGDDARALAERLVDTLDAAIRLAVQEALTAAAEEITCELAPGSVQVRLRGRDLEFVVALPSTDLPAGHVDDLLGDEPGPGRLPTATAAPPPSPHQGDDGGLQRINLRLPDHLKAGIDHAASGEGLSVNAWLVRAAAAALERSHPRRPHDPRAVRGAQRYTGWVR